jgi:hypothetical protein
VAIEFAEDELDMDVKITEVAGGPPLAAATTVVLAPRRLVEKLVPGIPTKFSMLASAVNGSDPGLASHGCAEEPSGEFVSTAAFHE